MKKIFGPTAQLVTLKRNRRRPVQADGYITVLKDAVAKEFLALKAAERASTVDGIALIHELFIASAKGDRP